MDLIQGIHRFFFAKKNLKEVLDGFGEKYIINFC